jgi:hypothetical protein
MKSRIAPRGQDAVEGLPLTLLVTMVVLAITIPLVFGSFRAYDRGRVEAMITAEIDEFISSIQTIYYSGPGNSILVDFEAIPGAMTGIDYVIFGDSQGGNLTSVIRYKLQNSPERLVAVISPNVPMVSIDGSGLSVSPGTSNIKAECVSANDSLYIQLELLH